MIENYFIAAIALYTFACLALGYWIGKAEGDSIAAGEPTETGVNGR